MASLRFLQLPVHYRLLASLVAAFALTGAGCTSIPKPPPPPLRTSSPDLATSSLPRAAMNLRVFDAVWNQINRDYYDPDFNGVDWAAAANEYAPQAAAAKDDDALYAVIDRMLGLLKDRHSGATSPAQAREDSKHEFTGIGISFTRTGDQAIVTAVYPDSPAKMAGVVPGWRIVSRDGTPVDGSTRLLAKKGQKIDWLFEDLAGQRVALTIAAQPISYNYLESRLLRDGIGYVRFDLFTFERIDWLAKRIAELRDTRGLVLDLRQNPGGDLIALVYALGHFVDRSQIVAVSLDRGETRDRWVPLGSESSRYAGKLVVLVSPASASCSEVFAAVIQEQGRGLVIGRPTAGAVLPAVRFTLPDGGILQYSKGDMITAHGIRLEGKGVTPDIIMPEAPREDLRAGRDLTLERAVAELLKP